MKCTNRLPRNLARLTACLVLCSFGLSANAKPGVSVNGVAISESLFDQVVKTNVDKGAKDTPEMRKLVKDELIAREVLAQESVRQGMDKTPQALSQLAQLRQNYLVEVLLKDFAAKNPVSDEAVRIEYERQAKALAEMKDLKQYQIGIILLGSEDEARTVLATLKKGAPFDKLAREKSIDPSNRNGGLLNWILFSQLQPAIANEVAKLPKGAVVPVPLQTKAGWNIVKLDGVRPYKIPSLAEGANALRAGLEQQQRVEYVRKLRGAAEISE